MKNSLQSQSFVRVGKYAQSQRGTVELTLLIQQIRTKTRCDFSKRRLTRFDQFAGYQVGVDDFYALIGMVCVDCRSGA